ncbi:hypothetical protein M8375_32245, partial [Klebsiella pneumoniae]|nr:hypothetical protein [Klebsiella pneumoniae]
SSSLECYFFHSLERSYAPSPIPTRPDIPPKCKHDKGEHVHPEIARYICLFLGAKVECFIIENCFFLLREKSGIIVHFCIHVFHPFHLLGIIRRTP